MSVGLVVMAGGKGLRLKSVLGEVPKALARVGAETVLGHHIALARRYGLASVTVLTGVGGDVISDYCDSVDAWRGYVRCIREPEPLGTAGALIEALPVLPERFILSYGDAMMDVALDRMLTFHLLRSPAVTILLHPNDHPQDSDLVEVDRDGFVKAVHGYPHSEGREYSNLVNAALYVVERLALERYVGQMRGRDIAKHLLPELLESRQPIAGYVSREYIKDIGTPSRLAQVNRDHAIGLVSRLNIENPVPAVFVDRDGTLNHDVGHLRHPDQLVLIEGVAQGLRLLKQRGYPIVILTNQPVIARGDCTWEELEATHARLDRLLGEQSAFVDAKYVCPHHPDGGYPGERAEYKRRCECRKPAPGLAKRAIADMNITAAQSWVIGDSTVDIAVAEAIGARSVLVRTGNRGRDGRCMVSPDFEFNSVLETARFITSGYEQLQSRLEQIADACVPGSVVAIGGLAHSAKSTCAAVLNLMLRERGMSAHTVQLDGWLLPVERRGPTVRERYDYHGIGEFVSRCHSERTEPFPLSFRRYDRITRTVSERIDVTRVVMPTDVLVLEGVPALDLPELPSGAIRCFVHCDENLRKSRFFSDYRARGYDEYAIAQLWEARELDEHRFIEASRSNAQYVIDSTLSNQD